MILIIGGAGYIGSHANKLLNQQGYKTVVYDNLCYGHKKAVKWGEFVLGDTNDVGHLRLVFQKYKIKAVMHFAAFAYVGESVENPEKYYINNVSNTLNILKVMKEFDCKYFIFSSTCATYGEPQYSPIDEKHPQNPINPYGQSKLMVEKILQDYTNAYDFRYVSLRYFNAAGCDIECQIGEKHEIETHLIPLTLDAALGKKDDIKVFGTNYNTPDGSAIRDYIHVTDISQAHILALKYLLQGGKSDVFNLGNGNGFSVLEIIDTVKQITKKDFKVTLTDKRSGDPEKLIGNATKIQNVLNWKPKYFQIETIIETAWNWHVKMNK